MTILSVRKDQKTFKNAVQRSEHFFGEGNNDSSSSVSSKTIKDFFDSVITMLRESVVVLDVEAMHYAHDLSDLTLINSCLRQLTCTTTYAKGESGHHIKRLWQPMASILQRILHPSSFGDGEVASGPIIDTYPS